MTWVLVPCLVALRQEFNQLSPGRDRSSDGSIGDQRHALTASDHNPDETGVTPYSDADFVDEVHAIDVDCTGPWPAGRSFDDLVEVIRGRHLSGLDDRLQNIIWNGWICSRSWGWQWQRYSGANPHDHHAHFSARYTTAQENDTRPWGLIEEDDVPSIEDLTRALAGETDFARVSRATPWRVVARPEDPKAQTPAMSALAVLNGTYDGVRQALAAIQSAAAADAQRDASHAAAIAGMAAAVNQLAAAKGALTSEQIGALTAVVRDAASQAGAQATAVVEAKLDKLREHLGDDE